MNCIRNAIIPSVLAAIFLCASNSYAQPREQNSSSGGEAGDLDERAFVIKALTQISAKLAEDEGREKAEISARTKAEQDAEDKLSEIRKSRNKAESELLARNRRVIEAQKEYDDIRLGVLMGGGDLREARKEITKASREKGEAQRTVEILAEAEQTATLNLSRAKTSRENAEQAFKAKATRRAEQKTELERLNDQWRANLSEENLIALTDQITAISCEQDIFANPFWKTTPSLGANLYYQSLGERRRGKDPHPINNPTLTRQPVCLGEYYVWSERGGRVTSNRDKKFVVYVGLPEIIVVEDQ